MRVLSRLFGIYGRLKFFFGNLCTCDMDSAAEGAEPSPKKSLITRTAESVAKPMFRSLLAFWILGLTNNFPYVVMLSAAHDILDDDGHGSNETKGNSSLLDVAIDPSNGTANRLDCNTISTGAILLADILPTLIIKSLAPFFVHFIPYDIRVLIVVLFQGMSFPLVALSNRPGALFGVVCASIASGLGEYSFLQLASYFDANVISTWASGTGGAGVFGALSYAALTKAGISPQNTLFFMLVSPLLLFLSYFILLVKPNGLPRLCVHRRVSRGEESVSGTPVIVSNRRDDETASYTVSQKLKCIWSLRGYMIPLCIVYISEYFINQGLHELLYFKQASSWLSHKDQYRWYQVDYQVGVLISRSSVNCFTIKRLWILPILQLLNVVLLLSQVLGNYFPVGKAGLWIVLLVVFYEGLLGGAAYVNTFYKIAKEVPQEIREFSVGAVSIADSFGIAIAGAISIPVHNLLCSMKSL